MKREKIVSMIICVCLLTGLYIPAAAQLSVSQNEAVVDKAMFILSAMNVLDSKTFERQHDLSRGEFIEMVLKALGYYSSNEYKKEIFSDVIMDNPYAGSIATAVELGFINGYSDKTFRPNDTISYIHITSVLVNAIGYRQIADMRGGYPTGYMAVSLDAGLFNGVTVSSLEDGAQKGNAAVMVLNAINAQKVQYKGGGQYEILKDTTIYKERLNTLNLYYMSGKVTAVGNVSISGLKELAKDKIQIDNTIYYIDDDLDFSSTQYWLGSMIEFFVEEINDVQTVKAVREKPKTTQHVIIEADNLLETSLSKVEYYTDEKLNYTESIILDNPIVIYNNRPITSAFDNIFDVCNGYIAFKDSDGDDRYDIAFINAYDSFVIDGVNIADGIIRFKDKMLNGKAHISIEPEESYNVHIIVDEDDNEIGLEDLTAGDTITVAESMDGKYIHVTRVNKIINGTVDEKNSDGNIIIIDGKEYKTAKNIDGVSSIMFDEIEVGKTARFFADKFGRLFYLDAETALSAGYAYIIGVKRGKGLNSAFTLKLLLGNTYTDMNNEELLEGNSKKYYKRAVNSDIILLNTSDKVRVGDRKLTDEQFLDTVKKGEVIQYYTNANNEISKIVIALPYGSSGIRNFDNDTNTFGGYLGGAFFATDQTVIFVVPVDESNEDNFFAQLDLFDEGEYDAQGYNFSHDTKIAAAAVINANIFYDTYDAITNETHITIVDSVTRVVNQDGEPIYKLKGYRRGAYIEKQCRASDYIGSRVSQLKTGDVVRISTDMADRVADIQIVQKMNTPPAPFHDDERGENEEIYGSVYSVELKTLKPTSTTMINLINVSPSGESSDSKEFVIPENKQKPSVYLYDAIRKTVSTASLADVNTIQNSNRDVAYKAYLFVSSSNVKVVLLVREGR